MKIKRTLKTTLSLILILLLCTGPVFGVTATEKPFEIRDIHHLVKLSQLASPTKPPSIGDAIIDVTVDSATSPTSTAGGAAIGKGLSYLERLVGQAKDIQASIGKAEKGLSRLMKTRTNIQKALSKLKKGSKAWNRTMRSLNKNAAKIAANKSKTAGLFGKLRKLKGLKLTGTALSVYGMYSDTELLMSGKYKHNHSSMRFLRDSLLGSNVAINGFLLTPWGQVPVIKQGGELFALGVGITKDFVSSDTFAAYMNSQNNRVLDVSDEIINNTNEYWTETFEGWIIKWYQYTGAHPSDAELALAQARHQRWLDHRNTGLGRKPADNVGVYKPNIYLYPEQNMQVIVTFDIPDLLTRVIPDYSSCWDVVASPDGMLQTKDGATYRYLFYESITSSSLYQRESGWVIKAETRTQQLEEIMMAYGFTKAETEDFVAFWTQKLEVGEDYAMYPQVSAIVDIAMPLTIKPSPDTLYRLWFAFDQDAKPSSEPQIEYIERTGFTAVEWGGLILSE